MPEPLFVEQLTIMAPPGFREEIREAARHEGKTSSEFVRQAVRDRLRTVAAEQPAAGD